MIIAAVLDGLVAAGQSLLVGVVCFVVVTLLASHLRYQHLTRRSGEVKQHGPAARTAFELLVAQRLGTAHRNPEPFAIARLTPVGWAALRELHGPAVTEELMQALEIRLRGALRATDVVMRLQEDEVGALIHASRTASNEVIRRVLQELCSTPITVPSGASVRVDAVAGLAAYPEDGDRAPELYAKAETALDQGRAAGRGWHWPPDTVAPELPSRAAHTGEADASSALIDELTGVLRPERMGAALQKFVANRRRDDLPVAMLALDVDMLRRYNQQYGRETGDALLKGLAQFLQKNTREQDLIARWQEDQFIVAFDCDPQKAFAIAQRIWSGVRKNSFGRAGLRLTVTIGVAGWPGHSGHARGLFEETQLALRVGKSKGRNQCILFDPEMRKLKVAAAPVEVF
jgi:diguanylate cyclase (GGDEF)-like protein